AAAEVGTGGRDVLVQVGHAAAHEPQRVVLHVLRATDQPPLLGVPGGEHHRALGTVPRLHLLGDGARRFQHAHRAAHVVARADVPRIAMAADEDHLVGVLAAADDPVGVPDRLHGVGRGVVLHHHPRPHGTGADVVAEGHAALPAGRYVGAAHVLQQLRRVPPGDGDDRYPRHVHAVHGDAAGTLGAAPAGCARVAIHVHDAPSLHAVLVAERALRVDVAAHE